jgi:hypothetical protein
MYVAIARSEVLSTVAEDSSLLEYNAVLVGEWFPTFRRNVEPSSSVSRSTRRIT